MGQTTAPKLQTDNRYKESQHTATKIFVGTSSRERKHKTKLINFWIIDVDKPEC
jgi:predicted RNase H-related nuclease YkuK (DUF458 family)